MRWRLFVFASEAFCLRLIVPRGTRALQLDVGSILLGPQRYEFVKDSPAAFTDRLGRKTQFLALRLAKLGSPVDADSDIRTETELEKLPSYNTKELQIVLLKAYGSKKLAANLRGYTGGSEEITNYLRGKTGKGGMFRESSVRAAEALYGFLRKKAPESTEPLVLFRGFSRANGKAPALQSRFYDPLSGWSTDARLSVNFADRRGDCCLLRLELPVGTRHLPTLSSESEVLLGPHIFRVASATKRSIPPRWQHMVGPPEDRRSFAGDFIHVFGVLLDEQPNESLADLGFRFVELAKGVADSPSRGTTEAKESSHADASASWALQLAVLNLELVSVDEKRDFNRMLGEIKGELLVLGHAKGPGPRVDG